MTKSAVVTARIDPELLARLDALGAATERPRGWLVAKAVERYVAAEEELRAFVQVGLDDFAAGRTIPHDELVRQILARRQDREAA